MINFDYEYTESDKPSPITRRTYATDFKLRLTAAQSLLLIRILPLLIAERIPENDERWQCFLLLCKIVDILACPVASTDLCGSLKVLIQEHHLQFIALYSEDAVIPKFHFLLHYPQQITRVGPMLRTWTMRHEAKLSLFKRASRLGNFKNIALSLAFRHQRLLCYELSTSKLLDTGIETGPCSEVSVVSSEPQHVQESLRAVIPGVSSEATISRPAWIKKDGLTFKKNNCYVVMDSDEYNPKFGRVDDILVLGGDLCILLITHCITEYFDSHFHAYVIHPSLDKSYVCCDDLRNACILHVHRCHGILYVYLKYYFHL